MATASYGVAYKPIPLSEASRYGTSYKARNQNLYADYQAAVQKARLPFMLQQQKLAQQKRIRDEALVERGKLKTEYETAYSEAKTANLERYGEIKGLYDTRYSDATSRLASTRQEVLSGLEGLGEAEKAGIRRDYDRRGSQISQNLISSGLHSTTIAPTIQGQNIRQRGYALGEAEERLRRERLGHISDLGQQELAYTTGLSKEKLDFMERREDPYPDVQLYTQLMTQLGDVAGY